MPVASSLDVFNSFLVPELNGGRKRRSQNTTVHVDFSSGNGAREQGGYEGKSVLIPLTEAKPTASITKTEYMGTSAEISMAAIVRYLKTNLKFRLAVITYMSRSVGFGFRHTAEDTPAGKKGKEIIDDFCDDWDMDTLNQKMSRDVWSSGNGFWNIVEDEQRKVAALYMLPLSSFTDVKRNKHGDVTAFVQQWGSFSREVPAAEIVQFRWLPIDEDGFGEGIGQPMARTGLGYRDAAGNRIVRPSWFEIEEKQQDHIHRMLEAGLPRYYANYPDAPDAFVDSVTSNLNKLGALQHFVTNYQGEIKTISLDTQNRFDSFIRYVDDQMTTGSMSALIRLWSSIDFTYASSEQAVKAMEPTIDMYQRAHKRLNEKFIYDRILKDNGVDPKEARVRLHWGKEQELSADDLLKFHSMLKDPMFKDRFDPTDFLKQMQEAGCKITPIMIQDLTATAGTIDTIVAKVGEVEMQKKMEPKSIQVMLNDILG